MKIRLLSSAVIGLAAFLFVAGCRSHSANAKTSATAPDFSLTALDGRKLTLSDYHGKVVLLNFWATWCGPCEKEIPAFVQLQNQYGSQGLQIVGISMDDSDSPVHSFYQRVGMNYPVALGDAKLAQLYGGIYGLPVNFVVARDGHIAARYVGATDIATIEQQIRAQLATKDR
jgi:peroxiredoxin